MFRCLLWYYNADRLKALGYTAETFPKTWDEFETLLTRLHQAGDRCAYTSAYPTWIHIESFLRFMTWPRASVMITLRCARI